MSAREIAGIAFGRFRKGVLVNLRVYFDGSGKEENDPVITVGGFLAESTICDDIERDWEAAGAKGFHLKSFGTNKCKLGSRSWTDTERTQFLKRLAGIVNRPECCIVSASLEVKVFNELLPTLEYPGEIGPAFSACAFSAVAYVEGILEKQKRNMEMVRYVFEKGDREHEITKTFGDVSKSSNFRGQRGYGFEPKSVILLEPADLIAGTIQRCVKTAHAAFPCLENGLSRTQLCTFDRHYSEDGVTEAVVSGHDHDHCWIVNPKSFLRMDGISERLFGSYPELLKKRMKIATFRPKATA